MDAYGHQPDVSRTFIFIFILLSLSAGRFLDGPNVPRTSEPGCRLDGPNATGRQRSFWEMQNVNLTFAGRAKRPGVAKIFGDRDNWNCMTAFFIKQNQIIINYNCVFLAILTVPIIVTG